ncbi:MAG: hypothetical protein H6978_03415 [Gammaproteobacteria bacterium]|nr:hypothetical protein [Gammaproteobacteria bacterium]
MSGTVEGSDNKQLRVRDFSARGIRSDFTLSTNADTWRLRLHGRVDAALPLQSLLAPLGEQLAAQQLTGGTLTVDATARGDDAGPLDFTTAVQLQSVNIEGVNVLQDVSGSVSLNATRDGGRWQLDIAASLQGGALYIEPGVMVRDIRPGFFVDLGQGAIDAAAKFQRRWRH